jgi:flagellum-specific ATP synthase
MIIEKLKKAIEEKDTIVAAGRVTDVIGLAIESTGPKASIGEICYIKKKNNEMLKAEVIGFKNNKVVLMPIGEMHGIEPGADVRSTGNVMHIFPSDAMLGRVLNGLGEPIDGKGPLPRLNKRSIHAAPPDPLTRPRIKEIIQTGVSAIDSVATLGKGQRIGIFSGSGVGKSTLLGMISRFTSADINVIALIGERGREVRDFIERDLGEEGLKKSVVVVATSNQPPLLRLRGAFIAHTIAEYYRDLGKDVMLMMDSVTRFARAQRDVGNSMGEAPSTRGFPPSVFELLPKLLERSGTSEIGSVTGLYTILVDADDMNEPVSDNVRGILDGHIILSRQIAEKNQYPAIDILASLSRLMIDISDKENLAAAQKLREILAIYRESEDLINIGAYVKGTSKKIDYALEKYEHIINFLKQGVFEKRDFQVTIDKLHSIFK